MKYFLLSFVICIFVAMKVTNPTKSYYYGSTRRVVRVLESNSAAYRSTQADYWNQRIWQEYTDCVESGGKVIFATFTYKDSCLPKYYYEDLDGNTQWFPTFSKRDKDRFLNSLLKRWEVVGLTGKTTSRPFKYIWANEYGVTEGCTHRPHYHVLFFVPKEIIDFEGIDEDHWKDLLRSYWTVPRKNISLGKVDWKKGQSIFVNSEFASLYCAKYMFKDDNLFRNERVREYVALYGSLPDDGKKKGSLTNHWQSKGFGLGLMKIYSNPIKYIEGHNFNFKSEVQKGKAVFHRCPQYIERHMLYDFDSVHKLYKLSPKGVLFKKAKFDVRHETQVKNFRRLFYDSVLTGMLKDSVGSSIWTRFHSALSCFGTIDKLQEWLHNIDSRPNFVEEASLYSLVWEGLCVTEDVIDKLNSLSHEEFVSYSYEQYIKNISAHLVYPFESVYCEFGVFKFAPDDQLCLSPDKSRFVGKHFEVLSQSDIFGYNVNELDVHPADVADRFYEMSLFLDVYDEINNFYLNHCEKIYKYKRENKQYCKFA